MISKERQLGDIAEILAGVTGFTDKGQHSYNVVQPNSFTETSIICETELQRRSDELPPKQLLSSGDILLKRLNPSFVHVVTMETSRMVASQNILVVRPGAEIDPFYLGYLLEQKEILGQVEHVTGSTAAIRAISIKKLADIMVPILPIAEQQKIGKIWMLFRKRKQLLNEYLAENDRLASMLALQIIAGGGKRK